MTERPSTEEFLAQVDPMRRELLAHCYRMMGSVHDAEDLVQETYLRAWRHYDGFEGRSSLRTWLYRIATTQCLTALDSRGRRPLPTGLGAPAADPAAPLVERTEVPWLEPVPDGMVGAGGDDPAAIVTARESIRLALVAALQHLPPRQRAVLILRDVLKWRAAEVAEVLDTTTTAVNSVLQRARAQLEQVAPSLDDRPAPLTPEQQAQLDRYVKAFEAYDVQAIVELFTEDAVFEMPPFDSWYRGPADIGGLISHKCPANAPGDLLLRPARANGQPAYALYLRDGGTYREFALQVVDLDGPLIKHVTMFFEEGIFTRFGLPTSLPAGTSGSK